MEFNRYTGLYDDSCGEFPIVHNGLRTICYATRFGVCGDGSGGQFPGDDYFQDDTALHYYKPGHTWSKADALNPYEYPFAVLPGKPNQAGVPDFRGLGLELGDVGVAFFGRGRAAAFIYGDVGPRHEVGEGSMKLADMLGMKWAPYMNAGAATGGFNNSEMARFAPGVIHIAFPGSRDRDDRRTALLTEAQVSHRAWTIFDAWLEGFKPVVVPGASPL